MKFVLEVDIGGTVLADGETGAGELARLLEVAALTVYDGVLKEVGDRWTLQDMNHDVVGRAALQPGWTVGEPVWVTTSEGALIKSVVHSAADLSASGAEDAARGWSIVRCRSLASHELLTRVIVDHWGRDQIGRPVLGRVVET